MNTLKLAVLGVSMIFGSALADDTDVDTGHEVQIEVIVADGDMSDATTIDWTNTNPDIDLQNMQVGESQSIVDDSGRSILVTKEENGLRFNVDGKSVLMPEFGEVHGAHMMTLVSTDGAQSVDHGFDIEVMGGGHAMASPVADGVMIVTKEPLDASTQESIRSVLQSAGNTDEVTFIDGSAAGSGRHVKVIRKKVEL
jgi:hypothetical protein